jgi:hypothetical protein
VYTISVVCGVYIWSTYKPSFHMYKYNHTYVLVAITGHQPTALWAQYDPPDLKYGLK